MFVGNRVLLRGRQPGIAGGVAGAARAAHTPVVAAAGRWLYCGPGRNLSPHTLGSGFQVDDCDLLVCHEIYFKGHIPYF